ncbi:hypothetical protein [Microbulbifer taiwanensis]|uniref:hypothetical protein n=1 Tax=Microbulbifer taiwanensis TaxID=986746 RepID=UPI00360D82DC
MSITTKIYNELAGSPFIIEAEGPPGDFRLSELKEWKQANNDFFKEKLLVHGAVWLRNFGVDTVERFDESLQQFKTSGLLDYTGGIPPGPNYQREFILPLNTLQSTSFLCTMSFPTLTNGRIICFSVVLQRLSNMGIH